MQGAPTERGRGVPRACANHTVRKGPHKAEDLQPIPRALTKRKGR